MTSPHSNEISFGQVVRDKRTELGYSLRKFAPTVGLSPSYVSLMERGEQPPPGEENIRKIALALNLNEDDLLAKAGKVSSELKQIIMEHPALVADFLRTAVKGKSVEELMNLNATLKQKPSQPSRKDRDP